MWYYFGGEANGVAFEGKRISISQHVTLNTSLIPLKELIKCPRGSCEEDSLVDDVTTTCSCEEYSPVDDLTTTCRTCNHQATHHRPLLSHNGIHAELEAEFNQLERCLNRKHEENWRGYGSLRSGPLCSSVEEILRFV
jgi:hypothetical protein